MWIDKIGKKFFSTDDASLTRGLRLSLVADFIVPYRHCFAHTNCVWEFFFFISDNIKLDDKLRCMQREQNDL